MLFQLGGEQHPPIPLDVRSVSRLRRKGSQCQTSMPEEEIKKPSKSDAFLKCVELMSVGIIASSFLVAGGFVLFWICFGIGGDQKSRLAGAVNGINLNWKIGLLLLIPLFYRTIRDVLERMEEGPLGTKFPKPKKQADLGPDQMEEEETRPSSEVKK
jgi:hypothetical protein